MIGNKPLMETMVSDRIWALLGDDIQEFEREVKRHLALGYKGFTLDHYDADKRILWLRDNR